MVKIALEVWLRLCNMKILKRFLFEGKDLKKDSYVWNMAGSMLTAFQSVILLMILRRTMDLEAAGIFTIANANCNLFLTIGKFGMRNFQVSDVREQFTFGEYRCSRWFTTVAMIVAFGIYVPLSAYQNSYSINKTWIIIWMCFYKVADSIEDVYYGEYQRNNRLDIGAKALTLRIFTTILIFAVLIIATRNLMLSLVLTTVAAFLLAFSLIRITAGAFHGRYSLSVDKKNLRNLFRLCLPLFLGTFFAFYIGNAPKYSIDAILSDELQACYGFIAMPVFMVGLLNNFLFNPMIYKMSCLWDDNKTGEFIKRVLIQTIIIFTITMICIGAAWLCGIPILSWLYNTDLSPYKSELLIMLLGGGFLGLSGFLNIILTIMRKHQALLAGYVITSVLSMFLSDDVVRSYGIMGAAVLYMVLMFILCIIFTVIFIVGVVSRCSIAPSRIFFPH